MLWICVSGDPVWLANHVNAVTRSITMVGDVNLPQTGRVSVFQITEGSREYINIYIQRNEKNNNWAKGTELLSISCRHGEGINTLLFGG